MTKLELNITKDIIDILNKYDSLGFIGTFYIRGNQGFTTIRAVYPAVDEKPFIIVQDKLVDAVNEVFGSKTASRETGIVHLNMDNNEMPH